MPCVFISHQYTSFFSCYSSKKRINYGLAITLLSRRVCSTSIRIDVSPPPPTWNCLFHLCMDQSENTVARIEQEINTHLYRVKKSQHPISCFILFEEEGWLGQCFTVNSPKENSCNLCPCNDEPDSIRKKYMFKIP